MKVLKRPRAALGIDIIAESASAVAEGLAESLFDRAVEPIDQVRCKGVTGREGMNPRGEKGFVDIDIAQSGDNMLIQEGIFNRAAGLMKSVQQLLRSERQRLGTHLPVRRIGTQPENPAKSARVSETKFKAGKVQDEMRMRGQWLAG